MRRIPLARPGPVVFAVTAALTLGALPATAAVSASPDGPVPPSAVQPPGSGRTRTVTPITGDKVTVSTAADGTEVRSFEGADGTTTGFTRTVVDGSTHVCPDSVLPYVGAGKLDRRLFDVTRLIADGHDDAHSSRLPLIVGCTETAAKSRRLREVPGSRVERRLDSVRGAALTQDRKRTAEFWEAVTGGPDAAARSGGPVFADGVAKTWLDGKVTADLAESTAQIGAPEVWSGGTRAEARKSPCWTPGWTRTTPASRTGSAAAPASSPTRRTSPTTTATARTSPRPSPGAAPLPAARSGASPPARTALRAPEGAGHVTLRVTVGDSDPEGDPEGHCRGQCRQRRDPDDHPGLRPALPPRPCPRRRVGARAGTGGQGRRLRTRCTVPQ